jgi:hypothetical protein
MINRLFALIALTGRRMDSVATYTADLRSASLAAGHNNGLSAAAATRW